MSELGLVLQNGANSGFQINIHPLPILNISEQVTRQRLAGSDSKVLGTLLGTQTNRQVSIVNSFELILTDAGQINQEFLEQRKDQFKTVFPTLDLIGWYAIGSHPTLGDASLHQQISAAIDTPIYILFDPQIQAEAKDLPLRVFESALDGQEAGSTGKFVELDYGIETGEAERIAVDGASRGGMGSGDEDQVVGSLVTQRNAIRMLFERITVLMSYLQDIIAGKTEADHSIIRQISGLMADMPTVDASEFRMELSAEHNDAQLTNYLTTLTQQLSALSDYTDRHNTLHPGGQEEFVPGNRGGGTRSMFDLATGRRRR